MIKLLQDELRVDSTVLKYATDDELVTLSNIAKAIIERAKKGGRTNE